MGKQKKGNANAQRNNNAKEMQKRSEQAENNSYAEVEQKKMESE
ncbi:hypothetical protein [Pseudalkalibacillus decolorationis]|nr:hypothetical protein [Pseudalkalibacillus decolorationis]